MSRVGSLSVTAEVDILRHNHKWFKSDHSLFLSMRGRQGLHDVGLAIEVHHSACHIRCGRWREKDLLHLSDHICSNPVGQNVITWLFSATKKPGKCSHYPALNSNTLRDGERGSRG